MASIKGAETLDSYMHHFTLLLLLLLNLLYITYFFILAISTHLCFCPVSEMIFSFWHIKLESGVITRWPVSYLKLAKFLAKNLVNVIYVRLSSVWVSFFTGITDRKLLQSVYPLLEMTPIIKFLLLNLNYTGSFCRSFFFFCAKARSGYNKKGKV